MCDQRIDQPLAHAKYAPYMEDYPPDRQSDTHIGSEVSPFDVSFVGAPYYSVDARISARWTGRTPARWRLSAPPICIRHELSAAAQISARVSRMQRSLSLSIASEVSAFLIAKVPPKPQH